jgi:hypothetical protein
LMKSKALVWSLVKRKWVSGRYAERRNMLEEKKKRWGRVGLMIIGLFFISLLFSDNFTGEYFSYKVFYFILFFEWNLLADYSATNFFVFFNNKLIGGLNS